MIEARMRLDRIKFGKFIAARREAVKGLETQEQLAKKLHVSIGYIGKLESGGGLPSFDVFVDLADVLMMTPGELMMVLAEREEPNKTYMEMNDWLYEQLVKLLADYQAITNFQPPPPYNLINKTPKMLAKEDEAARLADEQNKEKKEKENPQPTENITQKPKENKD